MVVDCRSKSVGVTWSDSLKLTVSLLIYFVFFFPGILPDREVNGSLARKKKERVMAGKAAGSVAKAVGGYQYPSPEKLAKYKDELAKGVRGYWELGAWKPLGIRARRRARLRKEVLLAGEDWPYDPKRKEMKTRRKGRKCDRIAAGKRDNTARLMEKMPDMLLDYKKRRWEKKMKEEDKGK